MQYVRMPRNKFWGWVVASLVIGLGLGLGIMFWNSSAATSRIASLEARLSGASTDASAAVSAAEARTAAAEASVSSLTAQNAQLTAELAAASGSQQTTSATESSATIAVTSRTVTPSSVGTTGTITMTAKVTGHPGSVTMRVYTSSKSFDKTYTLKKISTSGDSETWRLAVKAPATAGKYNYFATAIKGSERVTMTGASPKSFVVK